MGATPKANAKQTMKRSPNMGLNLLSGQPCHRGRGALLTETIGDLMLNGARWPPRNTKSKHAAPFAMIEYDARRHHCKPICFATGETLTNLTPEMVAFLTKVHRRPHAQCARWPPRNTKSKQEAPFAMIEYDARRPPCKTICFATGDLLTNLTPEMVAFITEMRRRPHAQCARWPPRSTKSKHITCEETIEIMPGGIISKQFALRKRNPLANMTQEIVAFLADMHRRLHTQLFPHMFCVSIS